MSNALGIIRNIDTLKVIGTIGPRPNNTFGRGGDNLYATPALGSKIAIQGSPEFLGMGPEFLGMGSDGKPTLSFPEPRFFRVVAVTPRGAYVKKWKDAPEKTWQQIIGLKS